MSRSDRTVDAGTVEAVTVEAGTVDTASGDPPVRLTPAALAKVLALRAAAGDGAAALRLDLLGRGAEGFQYAFGLVPAEDRGPEDLVIALGEGSPPGSRSGSGSPPDQVEAARILLLVQAASLPDLAGTEVDHVVLGEAEGFVIRNPNPLWRDPTAAAVQAVIDRDINPGLARHGGGVSLLAVEGDQAAIRLWGGCQGCAAARLTLKLGIERQIRAAVPAISAVVDRTDHAEGANPYYREAAEGQGSVFG